MKKIGLVCVFLHLIFSSCDNGFPDKEPTGPGPEMEVIYEPAIDALEGNVGDTIEFKVTVHHDMLERGRLTEINEVFLENQSAQVIRTIFEEEIDGLESPLMFNLKHIFKAGDIGREFEYGFEHKKRINHADGKGYNLGRGYKTLKVITKQKESND